jgi:protein-S-isoprenylcysteine O-methyltransferase Ste14
MSPHQATFVLFALWVLSWFAASWWADPAANRPAESQEWLYRALTFVGAVLVFGVIPRSYGARFQLWDLDYTTKWVLFGVAILGLAFAWWARLHLGRLWSSSVTRKADHHVVDTGPYGIVRHPIYTGLIVTLMAIAVQDGSLVTFAGVGVMTLGFFIKARLEEKFLREQLGAEAYDSYRRRVPMLMPFGPKSA